MRGSLQKKINLYTVVRDLLFNWWVIMLAFIIGFSGMQVYYVRFRGKSYTSSMTVALNLSGYTSFSTNNSLTRTLAVTDSFCSVLRSSSLINMVEEATGRPIDGRFYAAQKGKTNLIDLRVTSSTPEGAYRGLKDIYENYSVLTDSSFEHLIISPISSPNMPSTFFSIWLGFRNSVLTGVITSLLCAALIALFSILRDTVKNIGDVETLLDTKLFGTIGHINKRRCHIQKVNDGLLLTNPLIDRDFANSFQEMTIKLESLQRTKNVRSVMLTSIAENEGKTTTAVNLAIALADSGKKVLLLDVDLKLPAVYKFFQQTMPQAQNELGDYFRGKTPYESLVRFDSRTGVYLAGGKKRYRNSSEILSLDLFSKLLRQLEQDYDFVIVDTPPGGVAVDAEVVFEKTDAALFVVRQDYAPVVAINDYLINVDHDKLLGCVFNDICSFGMLFEHDTRDRIHSGKERPA